jgi:DNA-binding transcriptional LysR family regulator
MDRLEAMSAFAAVADRKSFSSAARHLKMSPPAVTRLVAGLEEHLGVALLRRTTRTVSVTDAGARYLERVRRILAETEEAESAAQAEVATPSGRLVISAPVTFGHMHISPLVAQYLKLHPQVSGELMLSDRYVNLVDDGIDVALRIGELADSTLIARRAGTTRRIVVGAPTYLAARGTPKTLADLKTHDIVRFVGGALDWSFAGGERVELAARYVTNSVGCAIDYIVRNGGLASLLAYQATEAIAAGELRVVLSDFERTPLPIQFVYPTSRLLSSKVRAFIDLALATRRWEF